MDLEYPFLISTSMQRLYFHANGSVNWKAEPSQKLYLGYNIAVKELIQLWCKAQNAWLRRARVMSILKLEKIISELDCDLTEDN